ncbi:QCR6 subunit6 of the ubiquinol cytochrome-c reductase complex [Moniliophthora roreri]|nr:QCR6 subunit6 of the ubiquinol cytochrome-c reductase complex [Moniliophthora roreri]
MDSSGVSVYYASASFSGWRLHKCMSLSSRVSKNRSTMVGQLPSREAGIIHFPHCEVMTSVHLSHHHQLVFPAEMNTTEFKYRVCSSVQDSNRGFERFLLRSRHMSLEASNTPGTPLLGSTLGAAFVGGIIQMVLVGVATVLFLKTNIDVYYLNKWMVLVLWTGGVELPGVISWRRDAEAIRFEHIHTATAFSKESDWTDQSLEVILTYALNTGILVGLLDREF